MKKIIRTPENRFDNLEDYATLPTEIYTGIIDTNINIDNTKNINNNQEKQNINFRVTDNIKKDITMNELFGYEESNETITKIKKKSSSTLNKWFISK